MNNSERDRERSHAIAKEVFEDQNMEDRDQSVESNEAVIDDITAVLNEELEPERHALHGLASALTECVKIFERDYKGEVQTDTFKTALSLYYSATEAPMDDKVLAAHSGHVKLLYGRDVECQYYDPKQFERAPFSIQKKEATGYRQIGAGRTFDEALDEAARWKQRQIQKGLV